MKFALLKTPFLYCSFVFFSSLLISESSQSIIIRHDKADSRYQLREREYPQVFFLHERMGNKACVATVIDRHWAITAAHCVMDTPLKDLGSVPYALDVAGAENTVVNVVMHPDYRGDEISEERGVDLALLELQQPVQLTPASVFEGVEEVGQEVMFLGWGFTGLGTVGRTGNDGEFRRAYNYLSSVGQMLEFRFDDPRDRSNQVHDLEGIPGLGDSGGPALIESAGRGLANTEKEFILLGVARGQLGNGEQSFIQGQYGAVVVYERLSLHVEWISQVLGPKS